MWSSSCLSGFVFLPKKINTYLHVEWSYYKKSHPFHFFSPPPEGLLLRYPVVFPLTQERQLRTRRRMIALHQDEKIVFIQLVIFSWGVQIVILVESVLFVGSSGGTFSPAHHNNIFVFLYQYIFSYQHLGSKNNYTR